VSLPQQWLKQMSVGKDYYRANVSVIEEGDLSPARRMASNSQSLVSISAKSESDDKRWLPANSGHIGRIADAA
jgi:hypothetical protein